MLKHLLTLLESMEGFNASLKIEKECEFVVRGDFRQMIAASAALIEEQQQRDADEKVRDQIREKQVESE